MAKKKSKKVKEKEQKIDGLNPKDIQNIRNAIRQVWSWSVPARLVRKRCIGADGFPRCENKKCASKGKPVPKVYVDHIEVMGSVLAPNYIQRMWAPSKKLQGLCKKCHDAKTKLEREAQQILKAVDMGLAYGVKPQKLKDELAKRNLKNIVIESKIEPIKPGKFRPVKTEDWEKQAASILGINFDDYEDEK